MENCYFCLIFCFFLQRTDLPCADGLVAAKRWGADRLHTPQLSVELCRPASSSGLGNEPREYSPTHILKRSPSSPNQRKCYIPWPHNPNNLSNSQCDSDTLPNKRMFLLPLLIASPRVSSTWPGIPSPTHDKLLGLEAAQGTSLGQSGKVIVEEIPDTRRPVPIVRGTLTRRDGRQSPPAI